MLERQAHRLHGRFAGRQPVAGPEQIQAARPQAVGAVVAVAHAGEQRLGQDVVVAVPALEAVFSLLPVEAGLDRRACLSLCFDLDLFSRKVEHIILVHETLNSSFSRR
jgi:hypothetical protein